MLLMDEPAFPGCVIEARLIGVIEATQTDNGKKPRNDRLIAVSKESHLHRPIKTIKDIDARLLAEIGEFFIAYNTMKGEKFKPLGHLPSFVEGRGLRPKEVRRAGTRFAQSSAKPLPPQV